MWTSRYKYGAAAVGFNASVIQPLEANAVTGSWLSVAERSQLRISMTFVNTGPVAMTPQFELEEADLDSLVDTPAAADIEKRLYPVSAAAGVETVQHHEIKVGGVTTAGTHYRVYYLQTGATHFRIANLWDSAGVADTNQTVTIKVTVLG